MSQRCVLAVIVLSIVLPASAGDAAITWPDPRHFNATVDWQEAKALTLSWPVNQYCAQNGLQNFSVSITKVGGGGFRLNVSSNSERMNIVLEQVEAEYLIVAEMKTKFNVHGVSANASIRTGVLLIGIYANQIGTAFEIIVPQIVLNRPVQEVSQVRAVGDGPFVVVLRHSVTGECLLVIYNESASDSYTIEATDLCRYEERASMAIALPVKSQPLGFLPKMHLLEFDLPDGLLESLPKFNVQTYSLSTGANFELDPPCDVYGKLELTSPKTAHLNVTFRPPASHPRLIHNFTFVFSHINETIVFEVVDDKNLTKHGTKNTIGYGQILRAQHDKAMHFEVRSTASYEYPGNYTVTAYTNNAVNKKAVHSIIMPKFCESSPLLSCHIALQPPHYELSVSWGSVLVRWEEPKLFQTSCTYLVDAIPYDKNASRQIQQPFDNLLWVAFYTLTPATKYSINLGSNCTGTPGVPRDLQLTQIGPKSVNLTWSPPLLLPDRHHHYEWICESKNNNASIEGKTEDTYKVLTKIGPGILSCTVQAVVRTRKNLFKFGAVSSPVELLIPSADLPQAPSVEIVPVNETTVSLNLMPVPRPDALGFIVTVDADLTISFCLDETSGPLLIENNGTLAVKALRTGPASFLLTGLKPYQSYFINVTTLFAVNYNTASIHVLRPVSLGYSTTPSSPTTPLTTVSTSTTKREEEVTTAKNGTTGTTEASLTTAQQKEPSETTHSTLSTAIKIEETSTSQKTEPSDYEGSTPPPGQKTEASLNWDPDNLAMDVSLAVTEPTRPSMMLHLVVDE
ncbi:hypothetical protein TSMEX_001220 [Taenia solium]|eukprot:TsM_000869800 transcript=TsM_000869800 gene=TsM_000869800